MENLGSISIFILLFVVWICFSATWHILQIRCGCDWLTQKLGKVFIVQSILRFFLETYFELLISSVLLFGMLETRTIWNVPDKISFAIQIIFLVMCAAFALFLIWFTIFGVRSLVASRRAKFLEWYKIEGIKLEEKRKLKDMKDRESSPVKRVRRAMFKAISVMTMGSLYSQHD